MAAIINDEKITYLGYLFNYDYHAQCLIDYVSKSYSNIHGFENLDYMEEPNLPVYYLTLLNNVVFTNISTDDEKRGILYLPRELSNQQIQYLSDFMKVVDDYSVLIVYNLVLDNDMVIGTEFGNDISTANLLNGFIKNIIKNRDDKNGKKYR